MTNNPADDFDAPQGIDGPAPARRPGMVGNIVQAWRTQPLFKLLLLVIAGGAATSAVLGIFAGPPPQATQPSRVAQAPSVNEPPGGPASPAFQEAVRSASEERAREAMAGGGSALPTPIGGGIDLTGLGDQLEGEGDPLAEFRAETERLRQEQEQLRQQQAQQQIVAAPQPQAVRDNSLSQAMQQQMQELLRGWVPTTHTIISVQDDSASFLPPPPVGPVDEAGNPQQMVEQVIIPAGTVNYAQLLTEANSDIPGPIMAQVLSGPFAGGRAIGNFEIVEGEYLIISFRNINYKGKDYPVDVLALDPDTTLGGLATETDQRYFTRVILPAAAAFLEGFGNALSQADTTTVSTDQTTVTETGNQGLEEGAYRGAEEAARTVGDFFREEAGKTRPLVRVARGTAMGLFFVQTIYEGAPPVQIAPPVANPVPAPAAPPVTALPTAPPPQSLDSTR